MALNKEDLVIHTITFNNDVDRYVQVNFRDRTEIGLLFAYQLKHNWLPLSFCWIKADCVYVMLSEIERFKEFCDRLEIRGFVWAHGKKVYL